jgi:hypothetical protein
MLARVHLLVATHACDGVAVQHAEDNMTDDQRAVDREKCNYWRLSCGSPRKSPKDASLSKGSGGSARAIREL